MRWKLLGLAAILLLFVAQAPAAAQRIALDGERETMAVLRD